MSHERESLSPELKSLEAALAGLAPSATTIERDRLLYAAGSAAAERRARRAWQSLWTVAAPAIAAVFLAVLFAIGGRWHREHKQLLAEREAHATQIQTLLAKIESPEPSPSVVIAESPVDIMPLAANQYSYLRLRNVVLEKGAEAIESPAVAGDTTPPLQMLPSRDMWLRGT